VIARSVSSITRTVDRIRVETADWVQTWASGLVRFFAAIGGEGKPRTDSSAIQELPVEDEAAGESRDAETGNSSAPLRLEHDTEASRWPAWWRLAAETVGGWHRARAWRKPGRGAFTAPYSVGVQAEAQAGTITGINETVPGGSVSSPTMDEVDAAGTAGPGQAGSTTSLIPRTVDAAGAGSSPETGGASSSSIGGVEGLAVGDGSGSEAGASCTSGPEPEAHASAFIGWSWPVHDNGDLFVRHVLTAVQTGDNLEVT
jgi:hypothetical protein